MKLKKLLNFGLAGVLLIVLGSCNQGSKSEETSDSGDTAASSEQMNNITDTLSASEVSNEELKKFLGIAQQLRPIQVQAQQEFVGAIQASGLNTQRFQELKISENKPGMRDTMNVTDAEKETMQALKDTSERLQKEIEVDIQAKVESGDMTWERFQKINNTLRSSRELQQKLRQVQQQMQAQSGGPSSAQQEQLKKRIQEKMQQQQAPQ